MLAAMLLGVGVADAAWPTHPDLIVPDPLDDTLIDGPREPAVAYSAQLDQYVVVWTYLDPTVSDPGCPDGVWSLASATSSDGLAWTPQGPLLQPTPGSGEYFECMAGQPTAVFDGDQLLVWFVANRGSFATPSQTGLGLATVDFDPVTLTPSAVTVTPTEVLVTDAHRHPTAVLDGTDALLFLTSYPDVHLAYGPPDALVLDPVPAAAAQVFSQTIAWVGDGFFSPAVTCVDNFAFPYSLMVGGHSGGQWSVGAMISSTGLSWVAGIDPIRSGRSDMRGFDVLTIGAGELLVYYEMPGPSGADSKLMAASTVPTWVNGDVGGGVCP